MAKRQLFLWDGQKSIDLDQYPAQAWNNLDGQTSDTDSRAAAGKFYETVAILYRCVELRQDGVARVPWAITRNGKDAWLNSEPSPPAQLAYLKDFRRLLRLTEAALCLSPEAFWFVGRNRVRPLSLRWHSPSSVIPQWSEESGLTGFKRMLGQGRFKMFEPEDYVYFARPNPNHETMPGRPPAQAALAAAGVLFAIDGFAYQFFQRGAIKATLLTAPIGTSPTERDRLKAWWKRAFSGLGNAFSTEVVSSEVTAIKVGEGLESLGNMELTRTKWEDIATALGVPHSLVLSDAANKATAAHEDVHFYDKTVIPAFERIAETLNEQLLSPQGYALELRPEQMSIYQEDETNRAASLQALVAAGTDLDLAMEILGYDLTEEQWARVKAPKPVPVAPVTVVTPAVSEPVGIADTPDKTAEIALLKRWAKKRKNPAPSEFVSHLLSDSEKAAIIHEVSSGTDFFGLTDGQSTRKNFLDDSTNGELEKRLEVERKAASEIAAGLQEQQIAVVSAVDDKNSVFAATQAVTESRITATEALRRALISGADLGIAYAAEGLESVGFGMDWTLTNEAARDWANQYSGTLIRQIDETTLRQVQQAVGAWVDSGSPLSVLVDDLAMTFGPGRAQRIAATEVTRAYAYANRLAYEQSGVVEEIELRTSEDELVCPICGPRAGTRTSVRNPDFNGYGIPPLHVQCRCWIVPVVDAVQPRQARQPVGVDVSRLQPFDISRDRVEIDQNSNPLYLESREWAKNAPADVRESIADWTKNGFAKVRYDVENNAITDKTKRILQAIDSAPKTDGIVYRGLNLWEDDVNRIMAQYQNAVGTSMEWDLPSSASYDVSVARSFGNVIFEFDAKTARNISALSDRVEEYESVIMPGTKFVVKAVGESLVGGRKSWIIQLEEVLP